MKTQIQTFENKLKELDEQKRIELNQINWDDIWSIDGQFQQTKTNDLIRMNNIPSTIKTLLTYQSSIKVLFYMLKEYLKNKNQYNKKFMKNIWKRSN
ncbi:hypothetical protein RFI_40207 [Reticulomyxa filosa]|uniref:Uncharacterized protein n=1 Tax=Reticulomyxa filosa TaxID=46433 RepID=X6L9C5_RETFI|nr:hypothetical protein RFI_40207 [Reticulomyxa filosa]|eukprot:ETN97324.1 hypothetical protein RFI_40207 [Reticulomyxa filosa]